MAQLTFKLPTLVINGVSSTVTIDQWAQAKLSAEDYAKFTAAAERNRAIASEAEAEGEIERTYMFETLPSGKKKLVGSVTQLNTGFGPAMDVEFTEFHEQFLSDPDLTWPA